MKGNAMAKYKHMMPQEVRIWESFLNTEEGKQYEPYQYDIHVGKASALWKTGNPNWDRMADALLKKRIDAVSVKNNVVHIFEVKPDAGLGAIGQLLSYDVLYRQEFNYDGAIELHLVTNYTDIDTETVAKNRGIQIHIVPVFV